MVNITKQEICIEETLKREINFICEFVNTTPTIINGSIRKINKWIWKRFFFKKFKNYEEILFNLSNLEDIVCQIKLTPIYQMTQNKNIQDLLYFKAINNNNIIKLTSELKEEINADIKVMVSILSWNN